MVHAHGYARLVDPERKLGEDTRPRAFSPEREVLAVRIEPSKEEDFRYIRGWLASSAWLDRLIAATDPRATARANSTGSPALHLVGRALPPVGRRLLQWRGSAVAARPRESQSNRR